METPFALKRDVDGLRGVRVGHRGVGVVHQARERRRPHELHRRNERCAMCRYVFRGVTLLDFK